MMRTRFERCIFFFLLVVVAIRVSVVQDLGHHTEPDAGPVLLQTTGGAGGVTLGGEAAGTAVPSSPSDVAPAASGTTRAKGKGKAAEKAEKAAGDEGDQLDAEADAEEARQEAMAARERAAQVAEGGAEGKPAEAAAASGSSSSSTEQGTVRARRVDRKAEGASWSVLDNVRMTGDGTQLVTHKRQFIVFNETLKHTVLRHWLEYMDGNETLVYHFPRSLFELLPLEEPQFHFKSCAVVGNSGVVLLRENGKEIDSHDAVIRINMAPVRGFETYVGSKTTFNIVNSHNVREMLQGLRHWTSTKNSRLVMFETASHFARYHLCQPLLKKFPQANPILLNPIFSNRVHRVWVQLKYLLEQEQNTQYNRKPMSGFFSVFYALNMCDKVDLYGFDAYTSKKKSYRYHYFDDVQGFTGVHSFDLAVEVYKLLADRGLVRLVT